MAMMRRDSRGRYAPRNEGGMQNAYGEYNAVTDRNVGSRPVDDTGGKNYDRPMENRRDSRGRYAPRNGGGG